MVTGSLPCAGFWVDRDGKDLVDRTSLECPIAEVFELEDQVCHGVDCSGETAYTAYTSSRQHK